MEEWKEYKLGEICGFQNGYAFKSTDFVGNGENRVVKIKELKDGTVKFFNDSSYITCNDEIKDKFSINYLDVLFALTGDPVDKPNPLSWVGRVSLYKYKEKSLMNQRVCKALPSEKIDNLFLYYYFRQSDVFYQLASKATGSASQANISTKTIADVSISLPPIQEQKKVASILKSLDDKIEVNRKINENLEQQAQALFKSWFVDFEPFKNGEFVAYELGMIPKGWRVYSLSEFLPVITGKKDANVAKGGPYPFFSCSQDYGWTDDYSFEGNAILVAGNGDFNVKMYNGKFEAYQRTYVLIPHNPQYTAWLFYAVKYHLNDITSAARGSVIKFITKGNLADFRFPAPSNLDKTEVIERFSCIKRIVAFNQQESRSLAELRDTLLPKLMSGELKVNEIEK